MKNFRKGDGERSGLFTRRALVLGGAQAVLMTALAGRLYQLQVVETDRFATMAEENRINMRLLAPSRGQIFDRSGVPLAVNRNNFRAMATSDRGRGADLLVERLDQIFSLGEAEKIRLLRELRRSRSAQPIVVRENLGWEEVARLEFNAPDLPGVFIDLGQSRDYPEGDLMSHIVGYTGRVADEDLAGRDDPVLQLATMRFGKKGVERSLEDDLRGRAGAVQVEVNAVGRVVRELDRTEGQPGANALLTIDLDIQRFATEKMKEHKSGSVVVLDVVTGDVIAMVSTPGFDPSTFARGITQTEWRDLLDNPERPLHNKAIAGVYPPGSTYKMVTALAALEAKAIDPWTRLPCPGFLELGSIKFHCWLKGGHGSANVSEAIAMSCDCFFYEAARRAGIDRVSDMAQRLGFGKVSELGLPANPPPTSDARLEAGEDRQAVAAWRHVQPRHRPGLHDGHAPAARHHDGAHRQWRLRGPAEPAAGEGDAARGAGAAAAAHQADGAVAAPQPAAPGDRAAGHVGRGQQQPGHGQCAARQAGRVHLRRQDRHRPGQAHHRAGARDGHHPGLAALAPAPSRAVRLLRPGRQSALCLRRHRGARAGRWRDRGSDRARRSGRDHEARSVAPHRPLQEDGVAMTLAAMGSSPALDAPAPVGFAEKIWRINWGLVLVLTAIAGVGVLALYSAAGGRFEPWAARHAVRYGSAFVLMLVVALIHPKVWLSLAWPIYIVSVLMLVAVDVIGKIGMGAQRWLVIGPMQIQPSEIAKVAVILVIARYYHGLRREQASQFLYTLPPLMMILVVVGLVMVQPDLGTAMMVLMGGGALLFVAGVRIWMFLAAGIGAWPACPSPGR